MPIIHTQQLQFSGFINYPNISITEGAFTFLSGPSGCGKTSFFHLLNTTATPTAGAIFYKERPLSVYNPIKLRREILLVNQNVFLFDDTIQNNFNRFYEYCELDIPTNSKIETFLKICAAPFEPSKSVISLSGGERQRIFTAICLSFIPKVLLLDEPTSALDEKIAHLFLSNIKNFCQQEGITVVMITHDNNLMKQYGDHIIYLDKD